MDDKMEAALTQSVEDEIRRGFKIAHLDERLQASLREANEVDPAIPVLSAVRFTKLTPKKRRLINKAVIDVYHADLQDKAKLSKEQIRKFNIERGEWSAEKEARMVELQEETTRMSQELYLDGFDQDTWLAELEAAARDYRTLLDEKVEGTEDYALEPEVRIQLAERFGRWYLWSPQVQKDYDRLYASAQQRETYSVDSDYTWLLQNSPGAGAVDVLLRVEEIRDRVNTLRDYIMKRRELLALQDQESKMFSESVEQRRDQTEDYARIYYITERVDDKGLPAGPLAKTLDALWEWPEDVISWLLIESYFFLNGIPDEAKKYLTQMGFLPPPQAAGQPASSDASPEEPSSKTDSTSAEATAAASSASTTATSLVTSNSSY